MSAYYLTFGAIFMPIGFLIYIETDNVMVSSLAFVIGMISMFLGIKEIRREEKRNMDIINANFENQGIIEHNDNLRHNELIEEIKKLKGEYDDKPRDHFQSVL